MINRVTLKNSYPTVILRDRGTIVIQNNNISVNVVCGGVAMPASIVPFSFTAEEGQTEFELETYPLTIICLFIQGTGQNEVGGDYSLSGKIITLDQGVPAGYKVYGAYQEASS